MLQLSVHLFNMKKEAEQKVSQPHAFYRLACKTQWLVG